MYDKCIRNGFGFRKISKVKNKHDHVNTQTVSQQGPLNSGIWKYKKKESKNK